MNPQTNLIEIPWTEITPSPLNALVRGHLAEDDPQIKELAASILEHGLLQPLLVVERGHGQPSYELVVGERRWLAAKTLGDNAPLLPCRLRVEMTELEQLLVMGVENLHRQNISPITEASYYQNLLERGLSLTELGQRLKLDQQRVIKRLQLLRLHPDVQGLIHSRTFPVSAAKHLYDLSPEAQAEVALKMSGRPVRAIAQVAGLVKKALKLAADGSSAAETISQAISPPRPRSYKTQVKELKALLAKMAAHIQVTGRLLAECALALEEIEPDLARRAGARAQAIAEAIRKQVTARKGGRDHDHNHCC